MSLLQRLAWSVTHRQYRLPPIHDVPKNDFLIRVRYGTLKKFRNYWKVRRAYRLQSLHVPGFPTELRVDPTSICNLRCPLCPTGTGEIDRGKGMMSLELFKSILDRFGDYLFYIHLWAWGDPILHKNLSQMIAMAEKRHIGSEVSTNLSVPLADQAIDDLIKAGLTWLIVSNDAATSETYNQYRVGGKFDLVMSNMRRFVQRKRMLRSRTPFVEWQWVPLKHNESEMHQAVELAREMGVDGLRFKPTRVDKIQSLTFEGKIPSQLETWMPEDRRLAHCVQHETDAFLDNHCPFLWRNLTIHYDGAIAPCCETYKTKDDFGTFADDFQSLWNGDRYKQARRVALGIDLKPQDQSLPCYGCKVFRKPHKTSMEIQEQQEVCAHS